MWANAQRDGRPVEGYISETVKVGGKLILITTGVPCSNAAKARNPLKFAWVPQTRQQFSAVSTSKFTVLSRHVEEVLLLNKFFYRLSIHAFVPKILPNKVVRWCQKLRFFASCIFSEPLAAHFRHAF